MKKSTEMLSNNFHIWLNSIQLMCTSCLSAGKWLTQSWWGF